MMDSDKGKLVYDRLRKKFVPLTPEERVRQSFVEYLIQEKNFPSGLMNNEVALTQNGIKRRCDTIVFDRAGRPDVIIEYKSPEVRITQDVFNQVYRYNLVLRARYIVVTNGMSNYCCRIDYVGRTVRFLPELPDYAHL